MASKGLSTNYRIYNFQNKKEEFIFATSKNPRVWGPSFWTSMFSTAAKYPKNNPSKISKIKMKNLFYSFKNSLPCSKCEISYKELLERFPIDKFLSSRKKLLTWLYIIRDQINRKLICLERNEVKKSLNLLPVHLQNDFLTMDKMKKNIMYTKASPSLASVIDKWFFFHDKK